MSTPLELPGVPTKSRDTEDELRRMARETNELRETLYGLLRAVDGNSNPVFGAESGGDGWGISTPRIHVPGYIVQPYISTPAGAGYTWTMLYAHTFKPESQQIACYTRWSVLEAIVANTAIGEFEWRWNKGRVPGQRGEAITNSIVFDSWDSGAAGSKGQDGSSIRNSVFVWPYDGSGPAVSYWDASWVSVALWGHIRTATGTANDAVKVAPLGLYQSGIGQE